MDEERQVLITRTLFDEHHEGLPVGGEPRDLAWDQLKDALGHVPQTEAWATHKHRPIVFALPDDGDVLFVLEVMADAHVSVQGQRLRSKDLTVRYVRRSRTNEWLFTYPDETVDSIRQPWQRIDGRAAWLPNGQEDIDQRETFARAIAARVGWSLRSALD